MSVAPRMSAAPPISLLSADLRTQIAGFTPPLELVRFSGVSRAWRATISALLPPSLARLAERCTQIVLQHGSNTLQREYQFYLRGVYFGSPNEHWDPRPEVQNRYGVLTYHRAAFNVVRGFFLKEQRVPILALQAPLLAYKPFSDPNQVFVDTTIWVGDMRTGQLQCCKKLKWGVDWAGTVPSALLFEQAVLRVANAQGYAQIVEQEGRWVVKGEEPFSRPVGIRELRNRSVVLSEGGRTLLIDKETKLLTLYENDQSVMDISADDADFDVPAAGISELCCWNGSYLALPISNCRLQIYKIELAQHRFNSTISASLPAKIVSVRIHGEKILVHLMNGQSFLMDANGVKCDELPLEWRNLEMEFRSCDQTRFLDNNRALVALSTGSVQIFDLSREGHIHRRELLPPCPYTRIMAMDYDPSDLSREFLALIRLMPNPPHPHPQYCVELWNVRAQSLLKRWVSNDFPITVKLQMTANESYLLVGCVNGEVRLLCSHQAKLEQPSVCASIWKALSGCWHLLSSLCQSAWSWIFK